MFDDDDEEICMKRHTGQGIEVTIAATGKIIYIFYILLKKNFFEYWLCVRRFHIDAYI